MGLDQEWNNQKNRSLTLEIIGFPGFWIITWSLGLLAICFLVTACERPQKIGNDKFSAIVITQHSETFSGKKFTYPKTDNTEIVSHLVEIKPGGETGRHRHPGPTYMYLLEGNLVVELDDGTHKEYQAGQALLEDAEVWINNKNPGTTVTKFIAIIVTEKGKKAVVFPQT